MITFATWPKDFAGGTAALQFRAIRSWTRVAPDSQVLLFGDEEGVAEAASQLGVEHVPGVATTEQGSARLDDVLEQARLRSHHRVLCLVNADVILLPDLVRATREIRRRASEFLLIGRCRELEDLTDEFDPDELRALASAAPLREPGALDYFVFPPDLFRDVPPLALGRAGFDNWLVWYARDRRVPVFDGSEVVVAIHQRHDYGHLAGGRADAYAGVEARRNVELAGGWLHLYNVHDASHRLTPRGIRRNWSAGLRSISSLRRLRLEFGAAMRRLGRRAGPQGGLAP